MSDPPDQLRHHRVDPASSPFALIWEDRGQRLSVLHRAAETSTGFRPGTAVVQATPACLIAHGEQTPQVFCASGWRPQEHDRTNGSMLDGARWTDFVRRFSALVPNSVPLPRNFRDTPNSAVHVPENCGRYYACHTEKKLGLYFLVQQMKHTGLGLRDVLAGRLRDVPLPPSRRRATIILGHKPCKNCLLFLRFIRRRTGIAIRTQPCPIFVEHAGRPVAFKWVKSATKDRGASGAEAGALTTHGAGFGGDDDDDSVESSVGEAGPAGSDGALPPQPAAATGQETEDARMDNVVDGDEDAEDAEGDEMSEDAADTATEAGEDAMEVAEALLANVPTGNVLRPRADDGSNNGEPAAAAAGPAGPSPARTPGRAGGQPLQLPVTRDTPESSLPPSVLSTSSSTRDRWRRPGGAGTLAPFSGPPRPSWAQREREEMAIGRQLSASSMAPQTATGGRFGSHDALPSVSEEAQPPPFAASSSAVRGGVHLLPAYLRQAQRRRLRSQMPSQQQWQALEVIDLTDSPDESPPPAPSRAPRPTTARRRRGATAGRCNRRRGRFSGRLASSSQRFPNLEGYQYNDLPDGCI